MIKGCIVKGLTLVACALSLLMARDAQSNSDLAVRRFSVNEFHAVGDGKHNDTTSIQQAIDACSLAGGGEVTFDKGTYLTGSIVLKSHVTLNVPEGVIIQGSGDKADYLLATARWEGMQKPAYTALISADHAEQIAIVGKGTIQSDHKIGTLRDPRGPALIEPVECHGVTIDGPAVHTFKIWAVHPTYCQDVHISNLTIENKGGNGDGIDVDSCKSVMIDNCSFDTDDDNLSIKSGKGQEGVRVGRPSQDITISNCQFIKGYCSIAFGSELSGGIRNVRVEHCSFKVGRGALYFKSRPGRAGYIEDVSGVDLDAGPCPLVVVDMNHSFNVDAQGVAGVAGLTQFKNITIRNSKIACTQAVKVVSTPDNSVDGVTIESITGTCAEPWIFKNAVNIHLKDIHVTGFQKNFVSLENAQGTGLTEAFLPIIATTVPTTAPALKPVRMVLIGDSTVCDYPATRPERGWGQFIQERFDSVTVINLAAAGRSSKTFISEGRWKKALEEKPDYVLIQFGHNDSHSADKPESTNAATDYRDNLRRYIDDARGIGATPILITPMVRRNFDAQGKIIESALPTAGALTPYADAMKAVGQEKHVAVIDLHASSQALMEKLGPDGSDQLADKKGAVTHFNEKGAKAMADLVMKELPIAEPKLGEYLKRP